MVALKEQKYHLYLSDDEYRQTIQSLVRLKNNLISQGRYTDAVDDVLFKVLKTKRACTRNNHILWLGKRRHNRPYRYRWKVRKRKCLHHRGQFVRHVQNQNISGWKFSYLRIRHTGILKKMAARLSSHQVHYSKSLLGIIFNGFCFINLIPHFFDYLMCPYYPALYDGLLSNCYRWW